MKALPDLFQRESLGRVLLEAAGVAIPALAVVFVALPEIPTTNRPFTFFFFTQLAAGWAALRLRPTPARPAGLRLARELAFASVLRVIVFGAAWGWSLLFPAASIPPFDNNTPELSLLAYTACWLPFLLYRLLLWVLVSWLKLSRRSLLWTMVNSHLVTVFILILLASLLTRVTSAATSAPGTYYPEGALSNLVLSLVRSVVPWVGITVVLSFTVMLVFFLPAMLISYLSSRRFVQRIDQLAGAMQQVRRGRLDVRLVPSGQDEVAQLQDDFNHMAGELQAEREKVAALLKNQRELSAVVSHELRTPVTVMRAYIEDDLANHTQDLPSTYRQDLETLHHEALQLQGLVEDLFTLSQLDAQRFELDCRWVDAAALAARLVAAFQPLAWEDKRIDLSAQVPADLPAVWADDRRLEQALGNLVQNAIRHTPPGGVVLLRAAPQGPRVVIEVIDSGGGITAPDLPHIWERFYRGAGGRGSGRTGIGLSLVKELVESMGGAVGVESRLTEGSRFWIELEAKARA
ncbi:MAG: HAMP domain-containing sensor histidine kinase [Anaerolineaceae bacterium]|nr:HAMP domain-containing sensor histidine kinase [Anaerolineaceae bacterium]